MTESALTAPDWMFFPRSDFFIAIAGVITVVVDTASGGAAWGVSMLFLLGLTARLSLGGLP